MGQAFQPQDKMRRLMPKQTGKRSQPAPVISCKAPGCHWTGRAPGGAKHAEFADCPRCGRSFHYAFPRYI